MLEKTAQLYVTTSNNLYNINTDIVLNFMKLPDIVREEFCNKNTYFSKLAAFMEDPEVVEHFVR